MNCPNCKRTAKVILFTDAGRRCHGCKFPNLDMIGNLAFHANQLRERAKAEQNPHMAKVYNGLAFELESEAAGIGLAEFHAKVDGKPAFVRSDMTFAPLPEGAQVFHTIHGTIQAFDGTTGAPIALEYVTIDPHARIERIPDPPRA